MSKIALDLKQFKHVNTDGDITTLKHKAGHVLTIAHDALSPEARTQLQALSGIPKETATPDQRQEAQTKMAKGGKVAKYCMYCGGMAHGGECKANSPSNPKLSESKKTPKMYADPDEAVSQDDSAPTQDETTQADAINPNPVVIPGVGDYSPHVMTPGELQQAKNTRNRQVYDNALKESESNTPNESPEFHERQAMNVAEGGAEQSERQLKDDASAQKAQQQEDAQLADRKAKLFGSDTSGPKPAGTADVAAPATVPEAAPEAPKPAGPVAQPLPPRPMTFEDHKQLAKDELSNEAAAWEHDLQNGHITPKTYADLFADKTTLQKVGIGFGMLLSGLGSGMAHQSNAVMDMMDKTIQNDLKAQEQSKLNAHNFLRLNQEQLLTQSQSRNLDAEAKAKSYALTQAQILQSTYHDMSLKLQNMPENTPQQKMMKQQAEQQLGMIYSKIGDRINNIQDQAAGAMAYSKMLFGGNQGAGSEQQFQTQMSGLRMLGPQGETRAKELESKHLPGVPGQSSVPIPEENRKEFMQLDNLNKSYDDAAHYIKAVGPFGSRIPGAMKAQGASLSNRLELEIGHLEGLGRFTPEEAKRYKGMIPDLTGTHFTEEDMQKVRNLQREVNQHRESLTSSVGLSSGKPNTPAFSFKPRQ